jgi:transposase
MAIAIRTGEETLQVQRVCLDELVPVDDVLRRVERLVSWEMVRETARPFYSDFGRPGIDPVVLVKVFLVAAIRGIDSMRETLRVAGVDLAIRRFLGYGLTERLPHHATFSYAQCVRFANSPVFEQLFTRVLASCREAGLLDGSRLIVDGTHVEANAALKSLRAELEVIDGDRERPQDDSATLKPGGCDHRGESLDQVAQRAVGLALGADDHPGAEVGQWRAMLAQQQRRFVAAAQVPGVWAAETAEVDHAFDSLLVRDASEGDRASALAGLELLASAAAH